MNAEIKSLPARDPAYFLKQTFSIYSKWKDRIPPNFEIITDVGVRYLGKIIDLEDTGQGLVVLMSIENNYQSRGSTTALSYIKLYGNYSVTIYEPLDYLQLIKLGQINRWSSDEALSALNLKRKIEETIINLKSRNLDLNCAANLIDDKSEKNNVVRDTLQALSDWVNKTALDDVGKNALLQIKNISIEYRENYSLTAQRENQNINLVLDPSMGLTQVEYFYAQLDSLF